jgi:hypothetical protein
VSDIFHEVDEEVRRERLKQFWERYGNYAITAACVLVLGIGAWRAWEWWQLKESAKAGAAFQSAMTLSEEGKGKEAEAAFARLASEGTSGYRVLARFQEAAQVAKADPQSAVKIYDSIAADGATDRVLRDMASIRAATLLVDSAPYEEIRARLEPLSARDRAFHHTARELLALSAWKNKDSAAARRWFDLILTDTETPAGMRSRVEVLMTLSGDTSKG